MSFQTPATFKHLLEDEIVYFQHESLSKKIRLQTTKNSSVYYTELACNEDERALSLFSDPPRKLNEFEGVKLSGNPLETKIVNLKDNPGADKSEYLFLRSSDRGDEKQKSIAVMINMNYVLPHSTYGVQKFSSVDLKTVILLLNHAFYRVNVETNLVDKSNSEISKRPLYFVKLEKISKKHGHHDDKAAQIKSKGSYPRMSFSKCGNSRQPVLIYNPAANERKRMVVISQEQDLTEENAELKIFTISNMIYIGSFQNLDFNYMTLHDPEKCKHFKVDLNSCVLNYHGYNAENSVSCTVDSGYESHDVSMKFEVNSASGIVSYLSEPFMVFSSSYGCHVITKKTNGQRKKYYARNNVYFYQFDSRKMHADSKAKKNDPVASKDDYPKSSYYANLILGLCIGLPSALVVIGYIVAALVSHYKERAVKK